MAYLIKEIVYTLQGEGYYSGKPAVLCRFSGCNLWSGREKDRNSAICRFCDTDFLGTDGPGGGKFEDAESLAESILKLWKASSDSSVSPFILCTGGEPLLQLDLKLLEAFHQRSFFVALETNGTFIVPNEIDWICVSPKAGTELKQKSGNELKLVYPQQGIEPEEFEHLDFEHFYLQPMDGTEREHDTRLAIQYCLNNPLWKLSIQMHKYLGIP